MPEGPRTNITKEEVISRELETAIALFFCDDDAVSIHVLASAASQILYDVCKLKGIESMRDRSLDYIRPAYHKLWVKKAREAFDYFKHARTDAFNELERFHPSINEVVLFFACCDYLHVYGFRAAPMAITFFFSWSLGVHPEMMAEGFPFKDMFKENMKDLGPMSPEEQRRWGRTMLKGIYEHLETRLPVIGLSGDAPYFWRRRGGF